MCSQDVDTRVDATLSGVSAALERSLSTVGVSCFNETREQYFTQLEAAMAAVQLRAPHLPAEAYLALGSAISAARSASVESACVMLATVVAAWEAFVAHPTVKEALCKSQLALLLLKKKAIVALRQIHSTHTYAVCEAKARSAVAAVQHHQRFQTYVEPALDSAMQRITSSAYYGCARCHPAAELGSGTLCADVDDGEGESGGVIFVRVRAGGAQARRGGHQAADGGVAGGAGGGAGGDARAHSC